jgi:hypothetical protein
MRIIICKIVCLREPNVYPGQPCSAPARLPRATLGTFDQWAGQRSRINQGLGITLEGIVTGTWSACRGPEFRKVLRQQQSQRSNQPSPALGRCARCGGKSALVGLCRKRSGRLRWWTAGLLGTELRLAVPATGGSGSSRVENPPILARNPTIRGFETRFSAAKSDDPGLKTGQWPPFFGRVRRSGESNTRLPPGSGIFRPCASPQPGGCEQAQEMKMTIKPCLHPNGCRKPHMCGHVTGGGCFLEPTRPGWFARLLAWIGL